MQKHENIKKELELIIKLHAYDFESYRFDSVMTYNTELKKNIKKIKFCRSIHNCAGSRDFILVQDKNNMYYVIHTDSRYYENMHRNMELIEIPSKDFLKSFLKDTIKFL